MGVAVKVAGSNRPSVDLSYRSMGPILEMMGLDRHQSAEGSATGHAFKFGMLEARAFIGTEPRANALFEVEDWAEWNRRVSALEQFVKDLPDDATVVWS